MAWTDVLGLVVTAAAAHTLFEVPLALIAWMCVIWCGFLPLWLALLPLLPLLGTAALIARDRSRVTRAFATAQRVPVIGPWVFSRLVFPVFAPNKRQLGLTFTHWDATQVRAVLPQRFWIQNPYQSIDLGALVSAGEVVGYGACVGSIPSNLRSLPVGVSARFHKKARGVCVVRAELPADKEWSAGTHTVSAEVRDAGGDLCAAVTTEFVISEKPPRR